MGEGIDLASPLTPALRLMDQVCIYFFFKNYIEMFSVIPFISLSTLSLSFSLFLTSSPSLFLPYSFKGPSASY